MNKNFVMEDFDSLNWLQWCTTPHSKRCSWIYPRASFETLFLFVYELSYDI